MSDQKPTLEYGRPEPPRKRLPFDIAIIVVVVAAGLASLAMAVAGCNSMGMN